MKNKDLLTAYKIITQIMKENSLTQDTSFKRVQSWLSNALCDQLLINNTFDD